MMGNKDWPQRSEEDALEAMRKSMSQEEFRREYLNEPILPRDLDGLRPSCVIIDDMGEQWQPANQKEVEEFMRRCNIWPHIQEPDGNGVAILKLPSLSKEKLEEFKAEWDKWARSPQPITVIDPEASIEFIPTKRPHRLHNHPRMEVELGLSESEVIVDQEFVHLFRNAYPVRGRKAKDYYDHFIVSKKEFLERMEESRVGQQMNLTTFSDRATKENALKDVYSVLVNSYRTVAGGFLYQPLDLLSKPNTTWHTCLQNGKLKCVMIHKETHVGKKVIMCGCDGTREGKKALVEILLNYLSDKAERYWCEASDAIEHWLVKHGMEAYPNKLCVELLEKEGEKIEYCDDGIHYIRNINGVTKVKAIYGNLCDNRINYNS